MDPSDTQQPAEQPSLDPSEPTPLPKESGFKRFAKSSLGNETRFGRWFRSFLRIAAVVVGMFALGLLSGYLLLYRPAQQKLAALQAQMDQAQIDLDTSQKDLVNLRGEIERVDQDNQALQDRLAGEEAHILLLQVYADVVEARMNLALKDNNAAKAALADTPALLEQFAPNLEAVDSGAAEAALSRLSLAAGEIPGDTKTAASDLAILTEQLSDLEAQLYLEDD